MYGESSKNNVVVIVSPDPKSLKNIASSINKDHLSLEQLCNDEQVKKVVLNQLVEVGKKGNL